MNVFLIVKLLDPGDDPSSRDEVQEPNNDAACEACEDAFDSELRDSALRDVSPPCLVTSTGSLSPKNEGAKSNVTLGVRVPFTLGVRA